MSCRKMKTHLADLLFEPELVSVEVRRHLEECPECQSELKSLRATMEMLEEWRVPEPGAFFDARLNARLRQERELAPPGLFSRVRLQLLYGSRARMQGWAAAALVAVIAVGGGSFAFLGRAPSTAAQSSATVRDLQSYDGNAQLFQQLNALDSDNGDNLAGNSTN